jgi:hypothetical protein
MALNGLDQWCQKMPYHAIYVLFLSLQVVELKMQGKMQL